MFSSIRTFLLSSLFSSFSAFAAGQTRKCKNHQATAMKKMSKKFEIEIKIILTLLLDGGRNRHLAQSDFPIFFVPSDSFFLRLSCRLLLLLCNFVSETFFPSFCCILVATNFTPAPFYKLIKRKQRNSKGKKLHHQDLVVKLIDQNERATTVYFLGKMKTNQKICFVHNENDSIALRLHKNEPKIIDRTKVVCSTDWPKRSATNEIHFSTSAFSPMNATKFLLHFRRTIRKYPKFVVYGQPTDRRHSSMVKQRVQQDKWDKEKTTELCQ